MDNNWWKNISDICFDNIKSTDLFEKLTGSLYGFTVKNGETLYSYNHEGFILNENKKSFLSDFSKIKGKFLASYSPQFQFSNVDFNYSYKNNEIIAPGSYSFLLNCGIINIIISLELDNNEDVNEKAEKSDLRVYYSIFINNFDIFNKIMAIFNQHMVKNVKSPTVHMITSEPHGLSLTSIGRIDIPLERDNYSDSILEVYDNMIDELNSSTPYGRIYLLQGPPGSGKTFMIKGILNECRSSTCIILPPSLLASIDSPNLLPLLLRERERDGNRSIILIVEDADMAMIKRGPDNIDAISTLLNLGDGMLGGLLDVRIIATTNAKKVEFDEAILRDGRLGGFFNIDKLDIHHANRVYKRLTKTNDNIFTEPKVLSTIYKYAKKDGWKPSSYQKNNIIGFNTKVNKVKRRYFQ